MVITVPIHQGSISSRWYHYTGGQSWWSLYQYTRGQSLHGDHCTNTPGVNLCHARSLYQYTRGQSLHGDHCTNTPGVNLFTVRRGQSRHGDHCTNTPGVNLFMVITVPIRQGSISSFHYQWGQSLHGDHWLIHRGGQSMVNVPITRGHSLGR